MSEKTEISWTDATFNPWVGCHEVSPGCTNCYARTLSRRFSPGRVLWGVNAERREFGDVHWRAPVMWNARAKREGRRTRVFCASMADVFDKNAPDGARDRLWALIDTTPHLDWLLLTKRIGNAKDMLPPRWLTTDDKPYRAMPSNVRIGITVIDQEEVDRDVMKLLSLRCPNFLSIEPMLGLIDLTRVHGISGNAPFDALNMRPNGYVRCVTHAPGYCLGDCAGRLPAIDWVITGGESGPRARPAHPDWFRSLRDQCAVAGVAYHHKQNGEWAPGANFDAIPSGTYCDFDGALKTDDERVWKVGKKAAGCLLDGVEHKAFPRSKA